MSETQTTLSPIDGSAIITRKIPTASELDQVLEVSAQAFKSYRVLPLSERIAITSKFLGELERRRDELAVQLTEQMGRPTKGCWNEVGTAIKRGNYLISIAESSLGDVTLKESDTSDHIRLIKREPVGPVMVISPWNYPYLCQINGVVAALLAGNTVLLKPSPQTPLAAEAFESAYLAAGLPKGVLQVLHITPDLVNRAIADRRVKYVVFTGSVANGHAVTKAASESFKGLTLELGGKDPAYVRPDVDLDNAVEWLVDGAFYNCGQSCCAVERIYVHRSISDQFIEKYVDLVKKYKLGDPREADITLGPVVSLKSAETIRKQLADAERAGAKLMIPSEHFPNAKEGTTMVAPQVAINCNHSMELMMEETFGPVVGIMTVDSDEEAIRLMNDSPYGLTASVWTKDQQAFLDIVPQLETGMAFMNGCDAPDPALPWSGVKDSGRGISMSKFAFDGFTQVKGVDIRIR
ncbi:succinate semialdehyde dehydrogenase [Naematelia encephala]|uniref:Succinate semialdehyde dehydrogenase n=1 Tax=Naematelia encephala TaxID=71784 RepID=A0A1Y2BEJ3_9TREE|nr:succinate semialdehyde dehydrogenase [Naematelia encephala]